MTEVRTRLPLSRAIMIGVVLVAIGAAGAVLSGFGHRWGWWSFGTGFSLLRWAVYASLGGIALLLLGAFLTLPGGRRRGVPWALSGLVIGMVTVAVPLLWLQSARSLPPIHDISTDTQRPPAFEAIRPLRAEAADSTRYPGAKVARQQHRAYPDIRPLEVPVPPDRTFQAALAVARDMDWLIVASEPEAGRIEAVDTTFWFGFKDDVVVRIEPEGEGSRVDVRSVSRVGRSDLGTNARRIRSFLSLLMVRLEGTD